MNDLNRDDGMNLLGDQVTGFIATVHAHPTMHEAVHEAALASEGRVINS